MELTYMPLDLLTGSWIPFRRRSGEVVWGSPSLLTDGIRDDPVISIAAPRPDFTGAVQES